MNLLPRSTLQKTFSIAGCFYQYLNKGTCVSVLLVLIARVRDKFHVYLKCFVLKGQVRDVSVCTRVCLRARALYTREVKRDVYGKRQTLD